MEKIVCSAIYINDGVARDRVANLFEGFVICGRRHSDCFNTLKILGVLDQFKHLLADNSSGFITTENRFVDRSEAYKIALKADQIVYGKSATDRGEDSILISENLWIAHYEML